MYEHLERRFESDVRTTIMNLPAGGGQVALSRFGKSLGDQSST